MTATEIAVREAQYKPLDLSSMRLDEAARTAAAHAQKMGLNPCMFMVSPLSYVWLECGLGYRHEYIDEEQSYLVLRTPARLLVGVDVKFEERRGVLVCRSPDVNLEVIIAS